MDRTIRKRTKKIKVGQNTAHVLLVAEVGAGLIMLFFVQNFTNHILQTPSKVALVFAW